LDFVGVQIILLVALAAVVSGREAAAADADARLERSTGQVCACTLDYNPVCGRQGRVWITYDNLCQARCERVSATRNGSCPAGPAGQRPGRENFQGDVDHEKRNEKRRVNPQPCICTLDYTPVCGRLNGQWKTFSNRCAARCQGVNNPRNGPCNASEKRGRHPRPRPGRHARPRPH